MRCRVSQIEVGDRYLWSGREVTVVDWKRGKNYYADGPSRYLIVSLGDQDDLQLHYFDKEFVEVPAPGEPAMSRSAKGAANDLVVC